MFFILVSLGFVWFFPTLQQAVRRATLQEKAGLVFFGFGQQYIHWLRCLWEASEPPEKIA
jgi:hypothetical protein